MYKTLAGIMKHIIFIFRFFQILGLLYLLLFVIYWFLDIMMSSYSGLFDFLYSTPIELTEKLLDAIGIKLTSEFAVLKPLTFISIILTFIVIIIYNFIFIPLDNILEFFVDKSYEKGEKGI